MASYPQVVLCRSEPEFNWTGERYRSLWDLSMENQVEGHFFPPFPAWGTISNLLLSTTGAVPALSSLTLTLRVNGSDTGITVTLNAGESEARDITHTVHVDAGDIVVWHQQSTGDVITGGISLSWEFLGEGTNESTYGAGSDDSNFNDADPAYTGVFSGDRSWEVLGFPARVSSISAIAGTLTRMYVRMQHAPNAFHAAPPIRKWTFTVYKNGVKQDGFGSTVDTRVVVANTDVAQHRAFTLPVSAGDVLYTECIPENTPWATRMWVSYAFSSVTGEFNTASSSVEASDTDVEFGEVNAPRQTVPQAAEANVEVRGGITTISLGTLYVHLESAPGSGKSINFRTRKNGVSTGPSVTIADTAVAGNNSATFDVTEADVVALQITPTGTPTIDDQQWTLAIGAGGAGASEPTQVGDTPVLGVIGPLMVHHFPRETP